MGHSRVVRISGAPERGQACERGAFFVFFSRHHFDAAHSEKNVYTDYADPRRIEWIVKIQPALKKLKLEVLVKACGNRLCRREIIEFRAGRKKPHRTTQHLLESILKRLGFL